MTSLSLSGLYRCGPTSVKAVKDGELSYPFDARFVFAEVRNLFNLLNTSLVYKILKYQQQNPFKK